MASTPAGKDQLCKRKDESDKLLQELKILAACGCFVILLYSLFFGLSWQVFRILGFGMLEAGAALMSGFLLGFIFAIPRVGDSRGRETSQGIKSTQIPGFGGSLSSVPYNDNLVEISDWLTKIIVGVGLVELRSIPGKLGNLSYYLAPALLPTEDFRGLTRPELTMVGQAAGLAILIFYITLGFQLGYVWTMICLQRDLRQQLKQAEQEKEQAEREKEQAEQKKQLAEQETQLAQLEKQKAIVERERTEKQKSDLRFNLDAESLISQNDLSEAIDAIDRALEINPSNASAVLTKARAVKRQAMQEPQQTDRERLMHQAIDLTDRAIEMKPDMGEAFYNRACYLALLKQTDQREEVLKNLASAFRLLPYLRQGAGEDPDFDSMHKDPDFLSLIES